MAGGVENKGYGNGVQDAWIASLRADVTYIRKRVDELHSKVAHMRGFSMGFGAAAGFVAGLVGPWLLKAIFT